MNYWQGGQRVWTIFMTRKYTSRITKLSELLQIYKNIVRFLFLRTKIFSFCQEVVKSKL